MQRWIAVSVLAMVLGLGGGLFAYYTYKQNRPAPVWVPLPTLPGMSAGKRDELIKRLKAKLGEHERLVKISHDVRLANKWRLGSDEEGASEIAKRLFVEAGEMDTPQGKVPSINIGVTGKRKEWEVSGELALRLVDDVWKILELTPPPAIKAP